PNEQIIDTIRREVLEESGFEMAPVDLVMIESIGNIFNFIYSGRVIGGQLKTVEDSESIEAKWWSESDMSSLNLRYDDILDVISVVRNHNTSLAEISCHISRFIAIEAHNRMLLRVVFTATKENNSRYVLIKKVPSPQLPQIFITEYLIDKLEGVLSVEHNGVPRSPQDSPHDGLCITVLAMSRVPYEDMNPITGDYEWMQMSRSLCALLTRCLDNPMTELIQWRRVSETGPIKPIVKQTVGYIGGAVVFNEDMDVLLIQESKASCRGKWYLPLGKIETNEQLMDGIKSEVLEESGLEIEPTSLVVIETEGSAWYRFTYTGRVIGGHLKTVEDNESIQAKWWSKRELKSVDFRCKDIVDLIYCVRKYHKSVNTSHNSRLPAIRAHNEMLLRVVLTVNRKSKCTLKKFLKRILERDISANYQSYGVLSVEHNGVPKHSHDGICLTVLVVNRKPFDDRVVSETEPLIPIVKQTVGYIGGAVIFNEDMDVLLIQESKASCRGKWYLPLGRIEPNEQLVDGSKREVLEESGLEIETTALVVIESEGSAWYRFTYTGRVIGGQLKTVEDKESIEAKWWSENELQSANLRFEDILDLIHCVRNYHKSVNTSHNSRLTAIRAHNQMLLRVVLTVNRKSDKRQLILFSERPTPHLPVCEMDPQNSLRVTLRKFLKRILGQNFSEDYHSLGVLSVEHNGVPKHSHDGLCLTVLVVNRKPFDDTVPIPSPYKLLELSLPLKALVMNCVNNHETQLIQWWSD
ncbi:unnamed protein product, partial [Oppiella nova]